MHRLAPRSLHLAFGLLPLFALASLAQASEYLQTDRFRVVAAKAEELGERHGAKNVLLVFDIDNTLLAGTQDLGSDQWFDWQDQLLESAPRSPLLAAPDFGGLLRAQGVLFTLGAMRPTEPDVPKVVRHLQRRGFPMLVLSSRGPEFRSATEKELARNQLDFAPTALLPDAGNAGTQTPYSAQDVEAAGLERAEAQRFRLNKPRTVSYDDGVFLGAGQHKGAMLLILLARVERRFAAVIFVDDKEQNTQDVFDALRPRGYNVVTFRYSREDENVRKFQQSDKSKVNRQWRRLSAATEEVFGDAP